MQVEEAAEARLADLLPGGVMAGAHFEYVKQWWAFRFDPNVLLLHYSDAVADPKTNIRRLAAFFGVNCTAAEVDRIAHLTSLESMKHDSLRFSCVVAHGVSRPWHGVTQPFDMHDARRSARRSARHGVWCGARRGARRGAWHGVCGLTTPGR
jgi:hypothetical protein